MVSGGRLSVHIHQVKEYIKLKHQACVYRQTKRRENTETYIHKGERDDWPQENTWGKGADTHTGRKLDTGRQELNEEIHKERKF